MSSQDSKKLYTLDQDKTKEDIYTASPSYAYMTANSLREAPVLKKLSEATKKQLPPDVIDMMTTPLQSQLFTVLARLLNMKKAIEIGTFTGYSVLNLAMALPEDGKIVCCDISEDYISLGKPFFKEAKVDHKIDIRIQPALKTLDELLDAGEAGTYDFAFIDADKPNHVNYYEKCLQLVRVGGIIALDNVFGYGTIWDEDARKTNKDVEALHKLNLQLHKDERVQISMLPVSDGVTLAYKL